jgi:plastocyanin
MPSLLHRLAAAGFALLLSAAPLAAAEVVNIDNFTFGPQTITVHKGTTVDWVNRDDTPHRVVATDKQFKSPVLDTDEKFSFTFTQPGKYPYFCSLHPHMTGTVVVTAD